MTMLLHRISPSMVVAVVALVLALAGTGYAAAALPKNSVTSKQVVDRSLRAADFASNQLPAGRPGAPGPAGPAGATGPQGPAGPSEVLIAPRNGQANPLSTIIGAAKGDTVRTLDLRPGRYLVSAQVEAENTSRAAAANVQCGIETTAADASPETQVFDVLPAQSPIAFSRANLSLERAVNLTAAGSVSVVCRKRIATDSVNARAGITAVRVGDWSVAP